LGSLRTRGFAADELATAFGHTVFDSDWHTTDFKGCVCGDDFVDAVWPSARVVLRAIDFIAKPGDGYAVNGVY
jgi:hypothetical protein